MSLLIIHGKLDVQVDPGHGERIIHRLQELNHPFDVQWYNDYGHHMPEDVHKQAIARMFDWIYTSNHTDSTKIPIEE